MLCPTVDRVSIGWVPSYRRYHASSVLKVSSSACSTPFSPFRVPRYHIICVSLLHLHLWYRGCIFLVTCIVVLDSFLFYFPPFSYIEYTCIIFTTSIRSICPLLGGVPVSIPSIWRWFRDLFFPPIVVWSSRRQIFCFEAESNRSREIICQRLESSINYVPIRRCRFMLWSTQCSHDTDDVTFSILQYVGPPFYRLVQRHNRPFGL